VTINSHDQVTKSATEIISKWALRYTYHQDILSATLHDAAADGLSFAVIPAQLERPHAVQFNFHIFVYFPLGIVTASVIHNYNL
jgi:hypothetical protein